MTITIRWWSDGDEERIRDFECYDPLYPFTADYQEDLRACATLREPRFNASAQVADEYGEIVGVVIFGPTLNEQRWTVRMLAVANTHKRNGLGTALKESAMASAAKRGALTMISSVRAGNAPMEGVNARIGIPFELDPGLDPDEPYLFYSAPLGANGAQ